MTVVDRPLYIFVSGPLTCYNEKLGSDGKRMVEVGNVDAASRIGIQLMQIGHIPCVPHLAWYADEVAWEVAPYGFPNYQTWMEWTLAWLEKCDAVYFMRSSPGADREKKRALELNLPVFYSMKDVPRILTKDC